MPAKKSQPKKKSTKSSAKSAKDCNCYATGFHPMFGQRNPQKKLEKPVVHPSVHEPPQESK